MKPQPLNLLIALLISVTIFSCKDKSKEVTPEEEPTANALILGSWNWLFWASDENGNQTLDDNEKELLDPIEDGIGTLIFYSNGVGKTILEEPGSPTEENQFTWSLINNNTLRIIDYYARTISGTDTTYQYDTSESTIRILNASTMLLEYRFEDTVFTNSTIIEWTGLERNK